MDEKQSTPTIVSPERTEQLAAKYRTPRNAIIRPEIVMGVPRYFLERWVPVLGPSQATLVNTLRQLAYRKPQEPVTISGELLAEEATMSRRHLYKCLQSPWFNVFVQVHSGAKIKKEGRTTRHPNQYTVRPADPLTPADAENLLTRLPQFSDDPIEAMNMALDLPARQLWASSPRTPTPTRFAHPQPIFAVGVVRRAFPNWRASDEYEERLFDVLAGALHRHLTLVSEEGRISKVIVPQYFRRQWWPLLGHDLAWIYLWLRSHTYDNPTTGVMRYRCWVPSLNTLLEVIGRPREWWRRNVDHARHQGEGWLLSEFFRQIGTQKGRDPAYPQRVARHLTVQLEIPVAPMHRTAYSQLLLFWPERDEEEQQDQPPKTLAPPSTAATAPTPEPATVAAQHQPAPSEVGSNVGKSASLAPKQTSTDKTNIQPAYENTTSHIRAQSEDNHLPHSYTINGDVTATSVHNEPPMSGTPVHKALPHSRTGSKILKKALLKEASHLSSSSHLTDPPTEGLAGHLTENAAAAKNEMVSFQEEIFSQDDDRPRTKPQTLNLQQRIYETLRKNPGLPLYKIAPLQMWLQQGIDPPVVPGTPAWNLSMSNKISLRDTVACILVVYADPTIKRKPNHLSWLMRSLYSSGEIKSGEIKIAKNFNRFRKLAALPVGLWASEGKREWQALCQFVHKRIPWEMDDILRAAIEEEFIEHPNARYASAPEVWEDPAKPDDGLDTRPGDSRFTIRNVWRVGMGHLKMRIGETAFFDWVEDCELVSYHDDVLTVRARDQEALNVLTRQFLDAIEDVVSGAAASYKIQVRFIVGHDMEDEAADPDDGPGQGATGAADALSVGDSS